VGTVDLKVGGPSGEEVIQVGEGFRFDDQEMNYRDVGLLGDCDAQIEALAERLGWREDLEKLKAEGSFDMSAMGQALSEDVGESKF